MDSLRKPSVVINTSGETNSLQSVEFVFRQVQLTGTHRFAEMADVFRDFDIDQVLDDTWTIHRRLHWDDFGAIVAERNDVWVLIRKLGSARIECVAVTAERAKCTIEGLLERIPPDPQAFTTITTEVRMWNSNHGHPVGAHKYLRSSPWSEVHQNFTATVATSIEKLLALDGQQPMLGRLMLWHGAPGTGKTSAILSLIHEWKGWCTAHTILDPERFFGDPGYIGEVVSFRRPDSWKLIIAEDCDQYLVPPPGSGVGGPLGQLLNLTDGMLGQGSNTLVLLTTNAPIQRVHPALVRPGRCLSNIEFTKLTSAEAARLTGNPTAPSMTLAEAYQYIATGEMPSANTLAYGYA